MDADNPKKIGVFVNALTGNQIIRELTDEEIAELPTVTETDIAEDETLEPLLEE
jgi:hypothetical protein